ncbi:MAG: phosphotransferase [Actinomycetota bacterium]
MIDAAQLMGLLPQQRWFGGKGRKIERIDVVDEAVLTDGAPSLVFAIVSVHLSDGAQHLYNVPLLVEDDGSPTDAFDDVDRLRVLGSLMTQGETIKGSYGMFHFGGPGLDPRSPPGSSSIRPMGVEQSNSSVVFDESVILKLFRRVASGPNPDLELSRLLTNDGFENIPAHVGEILYEGVIDGEEIEIDLGVAQQLVKEAQEGWQETVERLRELYDEAHEARSVREFVEQRAAKNLEDITKLGDVTASLHVLLSREELDPDVVSEQIDDQDMKEVAERTRASLQALLDSGFPELEQYSEAIDERVRQSLTIRDAGKKTRVHGDYHLGQVLLAPRGWMILDFEGEPMRSLDERRAKQSPLKDVAGMLRSFSYAASAALFERAQPDSDEWDRLQPWAQAWEDLARQRFLAAYLRTSHEEQFLPAERDDLAVVLDVFEIEKALYELDYERSHRPDWIRIPLRGIAQVIERGTNR